MQNQILGFFIITTVAFAGLSAVQWKRSVHYRDRVEAVQQEAFEAAHQAGMRDAEVRSLERRIAQRDEDTTALTEMVQSLMATTNELTLALTTARASTPSTPDSSLAGAESEGNPTGSLSMLGKMLENPAMREMMRAQQKMMLDTMYGPLFQDLRLNGEQTKALKELLLDSQMAGVELGSAVMTGDEAERQSATETLQRTKDATDQEIKALLGEEGFAVYEEYKKTMGDRVMLNQFKVQLEGSGNSLQEDQYTHLLQATLEEKEKMSGGFMDQTKDPQQAMEMLKSQEMQDAMLANQRESNARVLQRAQSFLSPEQLVSLGEFQENQLKMMTMGLEMGKLMAGQSGGQEPAVAHPGGTVPAPALPQ